MWAAFFLFILEQVDFPIECAGASGLWNGSGPVFVHGDEAFETHAIECFVFFCQVKFPAGVYPVVLAVFADKGYLVHGALYGLVEIDGL